MSSIHFNCTNFTNPNALYLGYVTASWEQKGGLLEGLGRLIGAELGRMMNKTPVYVQYDSYSIPGQMVNMTGILGDVMKGNLFTAIDTSSISLERIQYAKFSEPALYTKYVFVEGRLSNAMESSNLEFFVVFSWSTLVLIFFLAVTVMLVERVEESLSFAQLKGWSSIGMLRISTRMCFLYGSFFIVAIHGAGFNGNALVTSTHITQLLKLLMDVKAWKRTVLLKEKGNFLLKDMDGKGVILGDSYLDHIESLGDRNMAATLCSDPRYVTQVYDFDAQLLSKEAPRGCKMFIVYSTPSVIRQMDYPETFFGATYHLLFSKSVPSSVVKRVNSILTTIFQWDMAETYYSRRIIGAMPDPVSVNAAATAEFAVVNLGTLSPILWLYIGLSSVSCGVFVLECAVFRFNVLQRLNSMFEKILKRWCSYS